MNRRGFFGLLAGAVAASKLPAPVVAKPVEYIDYVGAESWRNVYQAWASDTFTGAPVKSYANRVSPSTLDRHAVASRKPLGPSDREELKCYLTDAEGHRISVTRRYGRS